MEEEYDIGSECVIWVNPFYLDVLAEVVAFDNNGNPIVKTLDEEEQTLEPHEFIFPTEEDRCCLNAVARHFRDLYGEEL